MRIIPTFSDVSPSFVTRVRLSAAQYTLEFRWNARERAYYLDIRRGGTPVVNGLRLVRNYDLLRGVRYKARAPQGALYCLDREDDLQTGEVTPSTLGQRYAIGYQELP